MQLHQPGSALCERCGKDIDLRWGFCPACGQDNRAPERRQDPIPLHTHQFNFGGHCIRCGLSLANPSVAPQGALTFQTGWTVRAFGWIQLLGAVGSILYLFLNESKDFHPGSWVNPLIALGVIGFLILSGLFHIFWVRNSVIDPSCREVSWEMGIRSYLFSRREPFSNFMAVRLRRVYHNRSSSYLLELQRADGSKLILRDNGYFRGDSERLAATVSALMGIPFDDQTGWTLFGFYR